MGQKSVKENKNIYHMTREELNLSRDDASELMPGVSPERIERIENEKSLPQPEDVLAMAKAYKKPSLCNYYCSNECPIGQEYVPEIKVKELPQIILEMIASLNSVEKKQERLIEITADGTIENEELEDFVYIQKELERISITVETLQLWSQKMIADGKIDINKYNELLESE